MELKKYNSRKKALEKIYAKKIKESVDRFDINLFFSRNKRYKGNIKEYKKNEVIPATYDIEIENDQGENEFVTVGTIIEIVRRDADDKEENNQENVIEEELYMNDSDRIKKYAYITEYINNQSYYDLQKYIDSSTESTKCYWGACKECTKDGTICALGTTCKLCCNKPHFWPEHISTRCGKPVLWEPGTPCALGTTCKQCITNSNNVPWYSWWFDKGGFACGEQPRKSTGNKCLAGTSCKACCPRVTYGEQLFSSVKEFKDIWNNTNTGDGWNKNRKLNKIFNNNINNDKTGKDMAKRYYGSFIIR